MGRDKSRPYDCVLESDKKIARERVLACGEGLADDFGDFVAFFVCVDDARLAGL